MWSTSVTYDSVSGSEELDFEVSSWGVDVDLDFEVLSWSVDVDLDVEVLSWCVVVDLDFEVVECVHVDSSWGVDVDLDFEVVECVHVDSSWVRVSTFMFYECLSMLHSVGCFLLFSFPDNAFSIPSPFFWS